MVRSLTRALALLLVCALAVSLLAGCGSSKKSSTKAAASTSGTTTAKQYRAGQFCNTKDAAAYHAQGFVCSKGHLKKR